MKINNTPLTEEQSKLAADHYRVAVIAARKFQGDPDENLSAAHRGLIHAARKFDPSRSVTFGTFAAHVCRSHLLNAYVTQRRRRSHEIPASTSEHREPAAKDCPIESDPKEIDRMLSVLPTDRMKLAVRMVHVEGMTYRDVSKRIGVGLSCLANDLRSALAIMRAALTAA